jgi:hypothetical protein
MTTNKSDIGALIGGALLIIFGALALLGQWLPGNFWGAIWPLIIIGVGGLFFITALVGAGAKDALGVPAKDTAALAIPGSIITTVGLILWLQNVFGHYQSWSYAWAVIIMAVGFGIFVMGQLQGDEHRRAEGLRVLKTGLVLFIIFGAFFEMVFRSFIGAQYLFPIALIVLGTYLLVTRVGPWAKPPAEPVKKNL